MAGKRIATASLVGFGVLAVMAADYFLQSDVGFFVVWGLIVALALNEFFALARRHGIRPYALTGIAAGTLTALLCFPAAQGREMLLAAACAALLLVFVIDWRLNLAAETRLLDPRGILMTLAGILAVGFLGSYLTKVRLFPGAEGWKAQWLLLVVIAITKCGDIGAFFVGRRFGRRKLAPRISPNKSVEGAVGGLAASVAVAGAASLLNSTVFLPLGPALLFGLVIGVVGPLGDLAESWFKRKMKADDSSDLLPGYGGVLDLIDSLLFAFPVAYYLLPLLRS